MDQHVWHRSLVVEWQVQANGPGLQKNHTKDKGQPKNGCLLGRDSKSLYYTYRGVFISFIYVNICI